MLKCVLSLTRLQKSLILLIVDVMIVPLGVAAAMLLMGTHISSIPVLMERWSLTILLLMAMAGAMTTLLGLNQEKLKEYDGNAVARTLGVALTVGFGSAVLSRLMVGELRVGFHIVLALVYFAVFFLMRMTMLAVLKEIYRHSPAFIRVAIYGAGRTGMALARELRKAENILVYAFLDDNATLSGMTVNGLPIYSGVHARKVKELFKINRVILAMPSVSEDKQTFIADRLGRLGLDVQTLPAFTHLYGGSELMDRLTPARPSELMRRRPLNESMVAGEAAYRGKTVLISGAGGSIGLELCRQMIACRPARLVMLELSEFALYNADLEMRALAETVGTEIVPVLGSVCDEVLVTQVLERHGVEIVLHAAAYKHVPLVEANARVGLANNALGTATLARLAARAGVQRFVLVSSDKAVRPGNLMGASKRVSELVVQDLAARSTRTIFSIVRFGNVLGSSGSVIPKFKEQIARGGPVTVTDSRVTRYFMTIEEASRLVLLAGSFAGGGEVYVLDMGRPQKIMDLARRMIVASGYSVRDAQNPDGDIEIVTTGLRPGEKLHEELMVRRGAQATAHPKIIRVREAHLSEIETAAMLRDLRAAIDCGAEADVIALVADTVQEYMPQSVAADSVQMRIVEARDMLRPAAE